MIKYSEFGGTHSAATKGRRTFLKLFDPRPQQDNCPQEGGGSPLVMERMECPKGDETQGQWEMGNAAAFHFHFHFHKFKNKPLLF